MHNNHNEYMKSREIPKYLCTVLLDIRIGTYERVSIRQKRSNNRSNAEDDADCEQPLQGPRVHAYKTNFACHGPNESKITYYIRANAHALSSYVPKERGKRH